MSGINLTTEEKAALDAIDEADLDRLIDDAVEGGRPDALRRLPLRRCGPYVANTLRNFEQALSRFDAARSAAKRASTEEDARRAGRKLSYAVSEMKHRREQEEREGKLFHIDDAMIHHPIRPGRNMSVTVHYRWRRSEAEAWTRGDITFAYVHDPRPDYAREAYRPKLSAARKRQEEEEELLRTWERLRDSALSSVQEYLRDGKDAEKIPRTYAATVDAHHGRLNNYSTDFWRIEPKA
ncbi:hypothetical protein QO001_006110 [Methylobacterium brachiatum]|uniref:Uncharacterized protein n=1 Tax=Methylobacterium brachiatum TaxID=269660 RepID=A0AAJ1WY09_9HYPH|nr:hypothetical protein [Methylobacterium brachiatum]MCB4805881.1 hypothetical protein [Methylobacterium brachiatum]MDQ0547154.1 hypothetical protein [Methylobacterium brachiatum]